MSFIHSFIHPFIHSFVRFYFSPSLDSVGWPFVLSRVSCTFFPFPIVDLALQNTVLIRCVLFLWGRERACETRESSFLC